MTLTTEPLALDPFDYAFQDDPYPTYAWLREHEPLHHNSDLDLWALTRHADIARAFRDEGTFSNAWGVAIEESAWGPDAHKVMSILGMDPPRQNRLRALVSRGFTPRRVADLLPRIQQLTDRYLAECLEIGSFDCIADFAGKLPMDVISEMMGVPEEDRAEVRRQADIVVHREDGVYDVPPAGVEASLWLVVYYQNMVDAAASQPTDDLTCALIEAELDGDRLTDEDVIALPLPHGRRRQRDHHQAARPRAVTSLAHPDQLAKLFAGPGTPSSWCRGSRRRCATTPPASCWPATCCATSSCTAPIAPQGSSCCSAWARPTATSGCSADPTEYDIYRDKDELANILSFGVGRHFCLGRQPGPARGPHRADQLVKRVRAVEVDHDQSRRVHSVNVRGFAAVPTGWRCAD